MTVTRPDLVFIDTVTTPKPSVAAVVALPDRVRV
jgi:hypothetical protein